MKNIKRIPFLTIILIIGLLPCLAQKTQSLSDKHKAQIIKAILSDYDFINRELNPNEEKNVIYLSTEKIGSRLIPQKIKEVKFDLKTRSELIEQSRAIVIRHFVFNKFEVKGDKILVTLSEYLRNTKELHLNFTDYEFRRVSGKWKLVNKKSGGFEVFDGQKLSVSKTSLYRTIEKRLKSVS